MGSIKGSSIVYNFAGLADIDESKDNPIETVKQNILGNSRIIEESINQKVKRFVLASSMYVYSKEGSFYRCSKKSCEMYLEEYAKLYGLKYTILRYGTLYGPRSNIKNGLYSFIFNSMKKNKLF